MDDNSDVIDAIVAVRKATDLLHRIIGLPAQRGARVEWPHNKQVWQRVGGDMWAPVNDDGRVQDETYPSAHVAKHHWAYQR